MIAALMALWQIDEQTLPPPPGIPTQEEIERRRPGYNAPLPDPIVQDNPGAVRAPPPEAFPTDQIPVPDRWRLIESLGLVTENWRDPYHQNVLKGASQWWTLLHQIRAQAATASKAIVRRGAVPRIGLVACHMNEGNSTRRPGRGWIKRSAPHPGTVNGGSPNFIHPGIRVVSSTSSGTLT